LGLINLTLGKFKGKIGIENLQLHVGISVKNCCVCWKIATLCPTF